MPRSSSAGGGLERWGSRSVLAIAWLGCLAAALTVPLNRDEHMYLGAASLLDSARLWGDFAFLQTPYSAWLYHLGLALAPGDWALLSARLVKAATAAGMVVVVFALARRLGARPWLAAGLVLLLFQNALVREMAGLARNYDFAQLSVLCALLLAPLGKDDAAPTLRLVAVGALATAAIGFKLTYAPLAALALAWPVLAGPARSARAVLALSVGGVLGLVPLALSMWGVDPVVVRFNLLDYHFLNAEFHAREGYAPQADLLDRAARGLGVVLAPGHRPLVGMGVAALLLVLAPWSKRAPRRPWAGVALAACFLGAAVVIGIVPRPLQTSYFAPVFFGLVLAVAALSAHLPRAGANSLLALCVVMAAFAVAVRAPDPGPSLRKLLRPSQWTVVRVHRAGEELAQASDGAGAGPVATTHPIFALEAGLPIYPELAAAEFAWRSGSMLSPDERERFGVACGANLEQLLRRRPPAVVLTEEFAPWDGPLTAWATGRRWPAVPLSDPTLRAWMR